MEIGGFAFGIWSHFASQQKPLLTYSISPVHGRIVRSGNLGDLKVLYKGDEVQGDISIAIVIFQNLGAAPIEKADILAPICIKLEGNPRILEAIIQKNEKTRFDITSPTLNTSQASTGQLGIEWQILEKSDGFVVQITYAGSSSTELQVRAMSKVSNRVFKKRNTLREYGRQQKNTISHNTFL